MIFSLQNWRPTRAVVRFRDRRWLNGIVYYDFHPSIEMSSHRIIKYAMSLIEEETCLKFQLRSSGDRILFVNDSGCYSSIGRQGRGNQTLSLGVGCYSVGTILHEILHALGMFHEQARPDRDDYVRIKTDNIKEGFEHNFQKRIPVEIDYHGEGYDYNSIMHYGLSDFRKSSGLRTIEVINDAEYIWQGQPDIGHVQKKALSKSDITQLNRMYNCPGSGVPGRLQVLIKNATNLTADETSNKTFGAYVQVTATDDQEFSVTRTTPNISFSDTATWKKLLDFGGRISWQYMTVSVWRVSMDGDYRITESQAFSLSSGSHRNLHHCGDYPSCNTLVQFDYKLKLDRDECNPNPCRNNGTCRDLTSSYVCDCPSGYSGPQCQHAEGRLRVYIRSATDLPRRVQSAYVYVVAYMLNDKYTSRTTYAAVRSQSPQWNYEMDFGVGEWYRVNVIVADWDGSRSTALSKWNSYFLNSHTSQTFVKMEADSGYVLFDYHFEIE